jgi:response regulator RpfG family c-di-GMP phosphodiesterase
MVEKILFVDDEPNVLAAFKRELRKQYEIETAETGEAGLRAIAALGPYAVVVSDFNMPGMDGAQFLSNVRQIAPDTVRIMLTGFASLETSIRAVNEGNIFRLLTKPCPPEMLSTALAAGIEQYGLIMAERDLLEKTLKGSVSVLSDLLGLTKPEAFGRSSRIKNKVIWIARQMNILDLWQLETAALLSQIGCVILPDGMLKNLFEGQRLTEEEVRLFNMHPDMGSGLIGHIPRMDEVSRIVAYQEKHFDGSGVPKDAVRGENIPTGARILKVALDFDLLETEGVPPGSVVPLLRQREGWYDPEVLDALEGMLFAKEEVEVREVRLNQLQSGMILFEDLCATNGLTLIARGQKVTVAILFRLKHFSETAFCKIREPFRVILSRDEEDL